MKISEIMKEFISILDSMFSMFEIMMVQLNEKVL